MRTLSILKLAFSLYLFLAFTLATRGQGEEYYIYQDPAGKLVISNKPPPPGSKIIKQQNLPEVAESQRQQQDDTQRNDEIEASPKTSKDK